MAGMYGVFMKLLGGFFVVLGILAASSTSKRASASSQGVQTAGSLAVAGVGLVIALAPYLLRKWIAAKQQDIDPNHGWDGDSRDARQKRIDATADPGYAFGYPGGVPPTGRTEYYRGWLGVVVFLVMLAVVGASYQFALDVMGGPKPIAAADLAAVADPDALATRWVTVKPDEEIDVGLKYTIQTRRGTTVEAVKFYRLGTKYLAVSSVPGKAARLNTGYVRDFQASDFRPGTADGDKLYAKHPNAAGNVLPIQLDARSDPKGDLPVVGGGLLFGAVLALLYTGQSFRRAREQAAVYRAYRQATDVLDLEFAGPRR